MLCQTIAIGKICETSNTSVIEKKKKLELIVINRRHGQNYFKVCKENGRTTVCMRKHENPFIRNM